MFGFWSKVCQRGGSFFLSGQEGGHYFRTVKRGGHFFRTVARGSFFYSQERVNYFGSRPGKTPLPLLINIDRALITLQYNASAIRASLYINAMCLYSVRLLSSLEMIILNLILGARRN